MFWRFGGYANISSIDNILDKPDVTLEELLDENDVIQELKAQNAKLIEFMRDDAVLAKLLQYVIAQPKPVTSPGATSPEPEKSGGGFFGKSRSKTRSKSRDIGEDPEKEEAQRKKYSYVASEILASEVWSITESLLDNTDSLRDFWKFVQREPPLDNLQAGYFTKVNEALLEKKPGEMVAFIKSLDKVIPHVMRHVDCPVIMDLLLKLISLEKEPAAQGVVDWLQQQDLIPILLSYIAPVHPAPTQMSAGDFLKAIITISANATGQDASVIGPNELTRQLVSDEGINRLLGEMLEGGNPLTVGVGIIIEVIRKNNSDYDSDTQIGPEPKSSDPIYLGTLLRIFANHIPKFMELILSPTHTIIADGGTKRVKREDLHVAWGDKIEPLGFDRFKTCELMAELLHCSNMGLLNEKGSEEEIRRRDAERERLKEAGVLASNLPKQEGGEFDRSEDSPSFHPSENLSPLGESPEHVRPLEVQNNSDEEEFEKVARSEAIPELSVESGDEKTDSVTQESSDSGEEAEEDDEGADARETNKEDDIDALDESLGTDSSFSELEKDDPDSQNIDKPAPLSLKINKNLATSAKSSDAASSGHGRAASQDVKADDAQQSVTNDESDQNNPEVQRNEDGSPVVGDLLKMMFVDHHVVPTILDFFFRFPWNNFLHNVVYDVVQQVFNGSMDRGFNRNLAIDLFETGRITNRIVEGQKRSDKAQEEQKMRLGYMGHLTLIAEEVVKFTERQPAEQLAQSVVDKIMDPDWIHYVEHTLTETRDRDNAILGGVRPDQAVGPRQAVLNAVNASQGGFGASSALASAGLSGNGAGGLESIDLGNAGMAGYGLNPSSALLSGFGSSDEEEEDEMEDGELGPDAADLYQHRQQIDDDDQTSAPQPGSIPPAPTSDPPPVPAPLAIPPSRARLRLAAQLAEKQRLASTTEGDSSSSTPEADANPDESTGKLRATDVAIASATATATAPASGAVSVPRRFGPPSNLGDASFPDVESDEDPAAKGNARSFTDNFTELEEGSSDDGEASQRHSSKKAAAVTQSDEGEDTEEWEDDDDDDEEEDEAPKPGIKRQTTREAVERRPLDEEEDSEEEEPTTEEESEDSDNDVAPAASVPPKASNNVTSQAQAQAARRSSTDMAAAEAKKREQEKLLRRWGFEEEDDDSDDDEPVQMGSKYLARRRGDRSSG